MSRAVAWLVQWTGFIALAGLIGAVAVDLLVLPARVQELAGPRVRLRRMRLVGILVFAAASAAELLLRSATMSGSHGLAGAAGALPTVLGRTHFGTMWSVRMGLLVLLLLAAWTRTRGPLAVTALLSLGVAATVTLTGHAGDWGDFTATAVLDGAHLVAAGAWTGGLFALALLGGRAAGRVRACPRSCGASRDWPGRASRWSCSPEPFASGSSCPLPPRSGAPPTDASWP
jgi:putative copper export protein